MRAPNEEKVFPPMGRQNGIDPAGNQSANNKKYTLSSSSLSSVWEHPSSDKCVGSAQELRVKKSAVC
jgi:hypothetical protein